MATGIAAMANTTFGARRQRGSGLPEVLISLLITVVGVFGLVGLQYRTGQASLEVHQRAYALILLNSMVDRLNTNRQTAQCYAVTAGSGAPYYGTAGAGHAPAPTCVGSGTVETQTLAVNDLTEWDSALQGASETLGGAGVGAMIGARGCIRYDAATQTYTVAVAWQGMADTMAPAVNCANGEYSSEGRRRVVWTTVQVATLI